MRYYDKGVFRENRCEVCKNVEPESLIILFSGHASRKTGDKDYLFYVNRNFLYLTGIEQEDTVLMMYSDLRRKNDKLYMLSSYLILERWNSKRLKEEEASDISGVSQFDNVENFQRELEKVLYTGDFKQIYLDLDMNFQKEKRNEAFRRVCEEKELLRKMALCVIYLLYQCRGVFL